MSMNVLKVTADAPLQPLILLVEPDAEMLASRVQLLAKSDHTVVTAKSPREIVALQCVGGVQIAVLSNSLELALLRSCAECVRSQWPTARILVLGCVNRSLEDHLYDESVDSHFEPNKLLDALAKLNRATWDTPGR